MSSPSVSVEIDRLVASTMPAGNTTSSNLGNPNVSTLGTISSPSADYRVEYDPENPEGSAVTTTGTGTAATGEASGPAVVSEEGLFQMQNALDNMLAEITALSARRDAVQFDRDGNSHFIHSDRERAVMAMQQEQLARSRALQARVLAEAKVAVAAQRDAQAAEVERTARIEAAAVARAEELAVERRAQEILRARGQR